MRFDLQTFSFHKGVSIDSLDFEFWKFFNAITGADDLIERVRIEAAMINLTKQEINEIVEYQETLIRGWVDGYIGGMSPDEVRQSMAARNILYPEQLFTDVFTVFIFFWNCGLNECVSCIPVNVIERDAISAAMQCGETKRAREIITGALTKRMQLLLASIQEKFGNLPAGTAELLGDMNDAITESTADKQIDPNEIAAVRLGMLLSPGNIEVGEA